MMLKKVNQNINIDFFNSVADLKKHVFINLREQIRQEMEGVSASQF